MKSLLLILLAITTPAHADISSTPERPPAFIEAQLSAVARLRGAEETHGGCTAVLIAPDAVLTAGHCAQAPATDPQIVIFAGAQPHQISVTQRLPHPEPARRPALSIADYRTDLAILRLATPVPIDVATPMPLALPDPNVPHAAYGFDNVHATDALRGHAPCVIHIRDEGLIASDCHVVSGQSGGALLQLREDGPHLVGVLVAQVSGNSIMRSIAAPLTPESWPALADVMGQTVLAPKPATVSLTGILP